MLLEPKPIFCFAFINFDGKLCYVKYFVMS